MLGHLRPSTCSLDQNSRQAYQNFYCSICASLRNQYSLPYSLFINNELTLVLLAFESEMERVADKTRCPSAGFTIKRPVSQADAVDLAARLSVLLGWVKVVDWNADKPAFYKKAIEQALTKKVEPVMELISPAFQKLLKDYLLLTKNNSEDFDYVNELTGQVSEQVVLEVGAYTDTFPEKIIAIGRLFKVCGQLISLADHLVDLEKDQLSNQYNPILTKYEQERVDLSTAYHQFLQRFNRVMIQGKELLSIFYRKEIVAHHFYSSLLKAFTRIEQEVRNTRPVFIDAPMAMGDMILTKATCGPEFSGAECDCSQASTYFDQQASQCCCKGGGCPCDNCCKGGGGGGCCCNDCCKGGGGGCDCCKGGGGGCDCCKGGGGGCDCCKGNGGGCDCCKGSGGCCKNGNHCCDCDCCCDGVSSGSGGNMPSAEEFVKNMHEADSLNSLKDLPEQVDYLKDHISNFKELSTLQQEELTNMVDSVSQHDPEKIKRAMKILDLMEFTEGNENTKGVFDGEKAYKMIKSALK